MADYSESMPEYQLNILRQHFYTLLLALIEFGSSGLLEEHSADEKCLGHPPGAIQFIKFSSKRKVLCESNLDVGGATLGPLCSTTWTVKAKSFESVLHIFMRHCLKHLLHHN